MFTKRSSLAWIYLTAACLVLLSLGAMLAGSTYQQQRSLNLRADALQHQLSQILPPFIAHYDVTAINRIVDANLSAEVEKITLTDQITAEQATWSSPEPTVKSHWYDRIIYINPVSTTTLLIYEGTSLATMSLTLSASQARAHVADQLLYLFLPLGSAIAGLVILFTILVARKQSAIAKATATVKKLAQQDFASLQSAPQSGLPALDAALDTLTLNIQRMIQSLHKELKTLNNSMMFDAVSTLPNREYFTHQLNSWMSESEDTPGAIFIAQMEWLDTIYRRYGYIARDETWRLLANSLRTAFSDNKNICIARISGSEIAILLPSQSEEQSRNCLHNFISTLNNEVSMAGFEPNHGFHIGAVHGQEMPGSQLLSLADNALQRAIKQGEVFVFNRGSEEQVIDRETWRELLSHVIKGKTIRLQTQPVMAWDHKEPLHAEVFTQALIDNKWQTAGRLMPYIQLFEKGSAFDRMVIDCLAEQHAREPISQALALNLTDDSLCSPSFVRWLEQILKNVLPPEKLFFEISEASARNNLSACITFSETVRKFGASVGVDHFGRHLQGVEYLSAIKPAYVKLDQAFSKEQNGQNRLFTEMLANIAESLDITVIATGIKDDESKQLLNREFIDAYQGFIHPPTLMIRDEKTA